MFPRPPPLYCRAQLMSGLSRCRWLLPPKITPRCAMQKFRLPIILPFSRLVSCCARPRTRNQPCSLNHTFAGLKPKRSLDVMDSKCQRVQVGRQRSVELFPPKHFLPNVRPELFDNVVEGGRFHLCSPVAQGLAGAALLRRIVSVREQRLHAVAAYLSPVEARTSRIGFGDEGARDCISGTVEKSTVPQRVIARVFM